MAERTMGHGQRPPERTDTQYTLNTHGPRRAPPAGSLRSGLLVSRGKHRMTMKDGLTQEPQLPVSFV
eukprot:7379548-Prymnesium_polylepis.1